MPGRPRSLYCPTLPRPLRFRATGGVSATGLDRLLLTGRQRRGVLAGPVDVGMVARGVRLCCGELLGGDRLDAVLVEELRDATADRVGAVPLAAHPSGVLCRFDLHGAGSLVVHAEPQLVLVERLVDLDVLAVLEPHDRRGL